MLDPRTLWVELMGGGRFSSPNTSVFPCSHYSSSDPNSSIIAPKVGDRPDQPACYRSLDPQLRLHLCPGTWLDSE
jgi:hypothetical protein